MNAQAVMLQENTFLNGSLKPVQNALSFKNLGSEPGEQSLTKMKNMKNLFLCFSYSCWTSP